MNFMQQGVPAPALGNWHRPAVGCWWSTSACAACVAAGVALTAKGCVLLKVRARKRAAKVGVPAKFEVALVVPHNAHKHVEVCFLERVVCADEVVPMKLRQRRRSHGLDFKLRSRLRTSSKVVVSAVGDHRWDVVPPQPLQHHGLADKPNDIAFSACNAVFQRAHFV